METKKSKYDTNPLDPDFVRETEEVWAEGTVTKTEEMKGATRQVGPVPADSPRANTYSEAPTRRYDSPPLDSPYQSVFVPPTYAPPPAHYQQPRPLVPPPTPTQRPASRSVSGFGLPENWSVMLPYAPSLIGVVVSLLELFLVPRKEVRVRFHAAQGLSLQIAILAIQTLFSVLGAITDNSLGGGLFWLASNIFLIVSMVRVWRGEPHRIAPLSEPAQWFNEHIEPRKQS